MPKIYQEILTDISETDLFNQLSLKPYFCYLDSADSDSENHEFSIMACDPYLTITTDKNGITEIWENGKIQQETRNPIDILDRFVKKYSVGADLCVCPLNERVCPMTLGQTHRSAPTPITIGFFSYEFATFFQNPIIKLSETTLPLMFFGFFNNYFIINKKNNKIKHIHFGYSKFIFERVNALKNKFRISELTSNFTKPAYIEAIKKAKNYIREGDIYQVNLSHQISANFEGNPADLYQKLRNTSPNPFSAFIKHPDFSILSASPERFIKKIGQKIITEPIKGTIARGKNPEEDQIQKEKLLNSLKDQAELLMITDLERNDLGSICKYGSIKVKNLKKILTFNNVFHLVAIIKGELKKSTSLQQIFQAVFPGGSITGAPKIRSMEIINELETTPRNIFTGAIGYINGQNFDFNIAIRTIYIVKNKLYFHVGGGIVADSNPEQEWLETKAKAEGILQTLDKKFPEK